MGVPFAMRWEVAGLAWEHGSFTEAAKVRALGRDEPGHFWVERLHPELKPEHRARVLRRWYLAARLKQPAWPRVVDSGDDGDRPWVVVEAPGGRADGAFRAPDPKVGLSEVRGLALAMAEAEVELLRHFTSPRLGVRPTVVARDARGQLRLQLAALDQTPDLGFPGQLEASLFTPEELTGLPASARTNVFVLGWLAALVVTGEWPYAAKLAAGAAGGEKAARELLAPLVLGGKVQVTLPESLKGVEPVLKRALSPVASARYADSAAFADALKPFTLGARPEREPSPARVSIPQPPFDVANEALPQAQEAKLLAGMDASKAWALLAESLDEVKSARAKLIRAQILLAEDVGPEVRARATDDEQSVLPMPGVTPTSAVESLALEWKWGYVRAVEVTPLAGKDVGAADQEARTQAAVGLLQHPSLRFVQEVRLSGKAGHAKAWIEALHRAAPPALKRVAASAFGPRDPYAIETAFRFPRWTFRWTGDDDAGEGVLGLGSKLKKLFGR